MRTGAEAARTDLAACAAGSPQTHHGSTIVPEEVFMSSVPIADHALLSDCHSAALVDRAGSVEWLGFPRFDSPSVFGRLLDDAAGHWSIAPTAPYRTTRRYLDCTLVLETTFRTAIGTATLTEGLCAGP